jgi:hypothetical protein
MLIHAGDDLCLLGRELETAAAAAAAHTINQQ